MILINDKTQDKIKKSDVEIVESEQQEYKLFGSFLRTKGLKLFSYNHLKDEVSEVEIQKDDEVNVVLENGVLKPRYNLHVEATVNTSHEHFEALNLRTARNRVKKFKKGIVKDLCNLRKNEPKPII